MQKKIIALAIASALTAPAVAMADSVGNVTLYGQANVSVDVVNDGANPSGSSNNLVSNASRVGVKGSEDLGGGLTAVFQAEKEVNMDDGTGGATLFDRNTYIGVASADMGTVLFGNHDTPYKISTRGLDLFADTKAADNRGLAGIKLMGHGGVVTQQDARLPNVIAYISPSLSGLTVAAASVFGAEGAASASKKGSAFSLAGMYGMDNIYATLAYQTVTYGDVGMLSATANDKDKAIKLGASYTMDAFKVNAVVEKLTFTPVAGTGDTTNTNLYLGGKFSLNATDAIKLAYTKKGDETTAGAATNQDDSIKQVSVGYDHDMSKRTSVYALYTKVTDSDVVATVGNPDPSTISIGLKHAF